MADLDKEENSEEISEETPTEKVEESLESEGELSASEAEKEYAALAAEDSSAEEVRSEEGSEDESTEEGEESTAPRGRGFYRYVKISLPTLNKLIIVLCVALVICLLYGIQNRGYLIDFDSQGGTAVESEKLMYSDKVIPPEDPYREGYTFTGWYKNADCTEPWDMDTGLVGGSMTLYAGWEKKDEE